MDAAAFGDGWMGLPSGTVAVGLQLPDELLLAVLKYSACQSVAADCPQVRVDSAMRITGTVNTFLGRDRKDPLLCWKDNDGGTYCVQPVAPFVDGEGLPAVVFGLPSTAIVPPANYWSATAPPFHLSWADGAVSLSWPCAVFEDGSVRCRPSNLNGYLEVTLPVTDAVEVVARQTAGWLQDAPAPRDVTEVPFGGCVRTRDGRVACFGRYLDLPPSLSWAAGAFDLPMTDPFWMSDVTDATALRRGIGQMCVLRATGGVQCWGWLSGIDSLYVTAPTDYAGELTFSADPVAIAGITDVTQIELMAWGSDRFAPCWLRRGGSVECRNRVGWGDCVVPGVPRSEWWEHLDKRCTGGL
ncbi:MAG: hypothetical protein D6761_09545 [Candidatus Dadabacteria bacterium]|nr:MAG: hypothetical protein D6761_09545 [Candidatus Dadabacteria bacterium]